jgi:hypothetical protein
MSSCKYAWDTILSNIFPYVMSNAILITVTVLLMIETVYSMEIDTEE